MLKFLLKKPRIYYILAGVAVILAVWFLFFKDSANSGLETVSVVRGDVVEKVNISGKVKPAESVELAFDRAGRVTKINAAVGTKVESGQILAETYNADINSDLLEAQATLKSEEAKLSELKKGSREEDIVIARAKMEDARQNLFDKIEDSYTKGDDAVRSKVDQFFSNPRTPSAQLNISISPQLETDIETARISLEPKFKSWATSLAKMNAESNLYVFAGESNDYLRLIKSFLDIVAIGVNELQPSPNISQTTIDSYRSDISTARTNINTAINALSNTQADLRIAESELSKSLAGSTPEEILVQEAIVERARANVESIRADLSKTRIVSPISGVVTKQDAKVGQIVSASSPVISVISEANFEVEANLPESDVAKVKVGNDASLTLDAYGDGVVFSGRVISIDPAETVVEGISTYKIKVAFLNKDERIRSGLTANVIISGERREGVLYLPSRAIITREGKKYVRIQNPDGRADEIEVALGLLGSEGRIEILSGVTEGTIVVISREII